MAIADRRKGQKAAAGMLCLLFLCGVPAVLAAGQSHHDQVAAEATELAAELEAERELLRLVNVERGRSGLVLLQPDERLAAAARAHARQMAQRQQLSHRFQGEPALRGRVHATGFKFDALAENVHTAASVELAHRGLMASPAHRGNLLDATYDALGIGIVRRGPNLFITQDFARRLPGLTPQEAQAAVLAAFRNERRRTQLPVLPLRATARLSGLSCLMAGKQDAPVVRGASFVLFYSSSRPAELPPEMVEASHQPEWRQLAVDVCFRRTAALPGGAFWVLAAYYK